MDATVLTQAVVERLFDRLQSPGNELVLFDVNRRADLEPFLRTSRTALLQSLEDKGELGYTLTTIANRSAETLEVAATSRHAVTDQVETVNLDLAWPEMVYSLSHVAIPFPVDDPVYGLRGKGAVTDDRFWLGDLTPRGEKDLLGVPVKQLMRLRHNPFYPYIEPRLRERR